MHMAYPANLIPDDGDSWVVAFPDVPEALTYVHDLADLQKVGSDCLALALDFYVEAGRPLPAPSAPTGDQRMVRLSMRDASKLAIYQGMLARGWSARELGRQLGKDEKAIRRLLDVSHASTFTQVEQALAIVDRIPLLSFPELVTA